MILSAAYLVAASSWVLKLRRRLTLLCLGKEIDFASTSTAGGAADGRGVLNAKAEVFYFEGSSSFDSFGFPARRQILDRFLSSFLLWFHVSGVFQNFDARLTNQELTCQAATVKSGVKNKKRPTQGGSHEN